MIFFLLLPFLFSIFLFSVPISSKISRYLSISLSVLLIFLLNILATPSFSFPWEPGLGLNFQFTMTPFSTVFLQLSSISMFLMVLSLFPQSRFVYGLTFLSLGAFNGLLMAENVLLFYLFWEMAIIPSFILLMGKFSYEADKKVGIRFLIYSIGGGFLMLFVLMLLSLKLLPYSNFDFSALYHLSLPAKEQLFLLLPLGISLGIKLPLFPFHRWQAETYAASPILGTMLLAGLLSKMGLYGLYKIFIPICYQGFTIYSSLILFFIILGGGYAAILSLQQSDIKKKLAYLSMSHISVMAAGALSGTFPGLQGMVLMSSSHIFTTIGLLWIVSVLKRQDVELSAISGLMHRNGFLSGVSFLLILGSIAFPLTSGFVGEFMILWGLASNSILLTLLALFFALMGAWSLLKWYQALFFGPDSGHQFNLVFSDYLVGALFVVLIIGIGVFPNVILDTTKSVMLVLIKGSMT